MIPTVFLGANQNQRTVTSSDVFVPVICNVYHFPCSIYILYMFALWCLTNHFLIYSIPNKDIIVLQGAVINHLYDTN